MDGHKTGILDYRRHVMYNLFYSRHLDKYIFLLITFRFVRIFTCNSDGKLCSYMISKAIGRK